MRTDVIEVSFKTKSQYFKERNHEAILSNPTVGSESDGEGTNNNEFELDRDGIFSVSDRRTWVEHAK
jgi:hypothetical protein